MSRQLNITPADFYAGLTYDAVWSIALALNGSLEELSNGTTLGSFTYTNVAMTNIFMAKMYEVNFHGQSVSIIIISSIIIIIISIIIIIIIIIIGYL